MKMTVDESLCKDFYLLLFLYGRRQTDPKQGSIKDGETFSRASIY